MKSVGFLIVFVINLFGLSCEGKALPQSNETTVIPDSTVRLNWTFAGDPSEASLVWFFTSRRVGSEEEEIAGKYRTRPVHISLGSLPGVAVELTPPTLVLKNVDERYNGIYRFSVQALAGGGEALVELYIAEKPNVTFTCLSRNEVDEGDDFTCVCKGENGSPPANVTWYKDGDPIGGKRMEENTLTLTSVNETSHGVYKCEARSHTNDSFADKKSIKLIVRQLKPTPTATPASSSPALLTVTIINDVLMFIIIAVVHMYFCKLKERGKDGQIQGVIGKQQPRNVDMREEDCKTKIRIAKQHPGNVDMSECTREEDFKTKIRIAKQHPGIVDMSECTRGEGSQIQGVIIHDREVPMNLDISGDGSSIQGIIVSQHQRTVETQQPGPSTVEPTTTSGSTENSFAMDEHTNQGSPSPYASLDTEAMQSSRTSKEEPHMRTVYASIDPKKLAGHALRQRLRDANNE